jgi:hypothetical protein
MDVSIGAGCVPSQEGQPVEYYGLVGEGPFEEVLVRREPRGDGLQPSDPGYRGMRLVSQEPTGITYRSFREGERAIAGKNGAIARARYGR